MKSVEIIIPVLNEEKSLATSVSKLNSFLDTMEKKYTWIIHIVDNGSEDSTPLVGDELQKKFTKVKFSQLPERGRGRALQYAWTTSKSDIVGYMDVDLSTDIKSINTLVDSIASNQYLVATGSRLMKKSEVIGRTLKREIISRCYSLLVRLTFRINTLDFQCGFKFLNGDTARKIVPLIVDKGWFFDTELILLAHSLNYEINEVPVRWVDDPDSRVKIISTAWEDVKGLARLKFGGIRKALSDIE
ncbi:MAG: glycosyl transferase [Chloroflexi bacterium]|nr:glycosyl transferase [Chloroflexota bacterium]MQG05426.1 glycosyltransferase [SAR202 cluster bacterium]